MSVEENLRAVRERIERAGGNPGEIKIVAVTKGFGPDVCRQAIVAGMKGRFSLDRVMTGRELCDLLHVNYEGITERRKVSQAENLDFFAEKLLAIPSFRSLAEKYI